MSVCYHCGGTIENSRPGRSDECSRCGRPLRVCKNCRFFDKAAASQCREPQAEAVADKESPNFCEWFRIADTAASETAAAKKDGARQRFEALFRRENP